MHRLSAFPFLLTACLVAASCGSSNDTAIEAGNSSAQVTEAPTADKSVDTIDETAQPAADDSAAGAAEAGASDEQTGVTAGSTSTGFESSRLAKIMAAQSELQSGRFTMSAVIAGGDEHGTIEVTGEFNTAIGASEIRMDLADMADIADIAGEDVGGLAAMFGKPMVIRTIGDDAYASGGIFSLFTGGSGWVQFDADDADSFTDEFAAGLSGDDVLDDFEGKNATMTEIGRETIDGVETTHFTVSVPDDEIADLDVWIDDNDLLRKLTSKQADEDETFGPDSTFTITMRYFDVGEPIDIVAPPQDQVIDGSQIASMFDN